MCVIWFSSCLMTWILDIVPKYLGEFYKSCELDIQITVKTVTLGGFNLKLIFDDRKLKILVFASFSPHRYNLPIVKGSFCRYASGLVALQSTCCCRRFTVGFTAGNAFIFKAYFPLFLSIHMISCIFQYFCIYDIVCL